MSVFWLALAGCAPSNFVPPQVTVRAAQDEAVFVAPALDAAVQNFLGPANPNGDSGLLDGITSDALSPDSDTPYFQTKSIRLLAEAELRHQIRPHLSVSGRVAVGQGNSRYHLPEGAGVLVEPIAIGFSTRFASAEAGLVWHRTFTPRLGAELGLAAGQRRTRTSTTITSPLLAVRHVSHQRDGYLALRGTVWAQPRTLRGGKAQLDFEVLAYPGRAVTTSAGTGLRF